MNDDLIFTSSGILGLSTEEQKILTDFLDAHDRAGFYMAYNAMTDSEEAKISVTVHSTVSTDGRPLFLNTFPYTHYFALNK
jgi:hypothetical protein